MKILMAMMSVMTTTTANLLTLSMDERTCLPARRAGLMMDYSTGTRTGLESLFVVGAGPSSVSNASTTISVTKTKQPATRRPLPSKDENGTGATSTSPKDPTSTSSTGTNNKGDD
jgi:hypothetical protein